MSTIFSSINLNSSPTRHLGEVGSLMVRQKSFQGGNDDVMSASVEPCQTFHWNIVMQMYDQMSVANDMRY